MSHNQLCEFEGVIGTFPLINMWLNYVCVWTVETRPFLLFGSGNKVSVCSRMFWTCICGAVYWKDSLESQIRL